MSKKQILHPVDESVVVPAAVKAAAAKAAEIHSQVYEPPADPVEPAQVPEPAAVELSPVVVEPAPAIVPEPVVTPQVTDTEWEHRYNSMKGRHDRLEDINRQLSTRVSGLEATLAAMSAQAPLAPVESAAPQSLITQEEIEQWGPEMLGVIERKAQEKIAPVVSQLEGKIAELNQRLQGVGSYVEHDARSRMFSDLKTIVPNWAEVNENKSFISWLGLPDAFSGVIRDQLLQAAFAANDAPRVAAFFKGFLSEEAALAPQVPEPAPTTPVVPKVPPVATGATTPAIYPAGSAGNGFRLRASSPKSGRAS
jgi:hypothetical protein